MILTDEDIENIAHVLEPEQVNVIGSVRQVLGELAPAIELVVTLREEAEEEPAIRAKPRRPARTPMEWALRWGDDADEPEQAGHTR